MLLRRAKTMGLRFPCGEATSLPSVGNGWKADIRHGATRPANKRPARSSVGSLSLPCRLRELPIAVSSQPKLKAARQICTEPPSGAPAGEWSRSV